MTSEADALETSEADARGLRQKWRDANREFEARNCWGPADGPPFRIRPAHRVLVTAVHAVTHRRGGLTKENDANTGGLAIVLAERLGAALAVVRRSAEWDDANRAVDHPFKGAVEHAGLMVPNTLVIDLHAMADRPDGIEVSLGWGGHDPSGVPAQILADHLGHRGYCVDPDGSRTGLGATGPGTITAWAQGLGAVAIQVEINHALRTFAAGSDGLRSGRFVADLATGIAAAVSADEE